MLEVLEIELNTAYRKYKESVHMFLVAHLISQPITEMEIRKLQLCLA
jgi:hypothetical protein